MATATKPAETAAPAETAVTPDTAKVTRNHAEWVVERQYDGVTLVPAVEATDDTPATEAVTATIFTRIHTGKFANGRGAIQAAIQADPALVKLFEAGKTPPLRALPKSIADKTESPKGQVELKTVWS